MKYPEGYNQNNTQIVQVLVNCNPYDEWNIGATSVSVALEESHIHIVHLRKLDNLKILLAKKSIIPEVQASEVP